MKFRPGYLISPSKMFNNLINAGHRNRHPAGSGFIVKKAAFLFLFCALTLHPQTYLGITYNGGAAANSTPLSSIKLITFSGTEVSFLLTDNTTVTKSTSEISKMTFGTDGGNPLPVELVSFKAKNKKGYILLEWSTATEVNNYGFEIERSQAGNQKNEIRWEKL